MKKQLESIEKIIKTKKCFKRKRILITVPTLHSKGGVSNYYRTIRDYFSVDFDFFTVGPFRWEEKTQFERIRRFVLDPVRFWYYLLKRQKDYKLIHLNPSFEYGSLLREAILLIIAKSWKKKTVIFFRGFDMAHAKIVDKYLKRIFCLIYRRSDVFIVLSKESHDQLVKWGFTQPIYIETTLVDDKLVNNFSIESRLDRINRVRKTKLLFLSRIVKEKGVLETLQAFKQLLEHNDNLTLTIAGDGSYLRHAVKFVKESNIYNSVFFLGFVCGEAKKQVFINSDIYIFPSYTEGMPNSVLEAMSFGLPIVATPVGGIKDVVKNGEHGFLLEENVPEKIATAVAAIINDKDLQKTMSINCFNAGHRFLASQVAGRLEGIYDTITKK